jgi:hypothetical protein
MRCAIRKTTCSTPSWNRTEPNATTRSAASRRTENGEYETHKPCCRVEATSTELKGFVDAKVAAAAPPEAGEEQYNWQRPLATSARDRLWQEREQNARRALRPFKFWLPLGLLALLASGIYWQRWRRTLAIVDKTAEETRHE